MITPRVIISSNLIEDHMHPFSMDATTFRIICYNTNLLLLLLNDKMVSGY